MYIFPDQAHMNNFMHSLRISPAAVKENVVPCIESHQVTSSFGMLLHVLYNYACRRLYVTIKYVIPFDQEIRVAFSSSA